MIVFEEQVLESLSLFEIIRDRFALLLNGERKIGSTKIRNYDISFGNFKESLFLIFVIAIMAFIMTLAVSIFILLSGVSDKWEEGVEGKFTIEIPSASKSGELYPQEDMKQITEQIKKSLSKLNGIEKIEVLNEKEVSEMLAQWFGDTIEFAGLSMPRLINAEINSKSEEETLKAVNKIIADSKGRAVLDTHEIWADNLTRMIDMIRASSLFVTLVIIVATIATIAGAVKNQLYIKSGEVEILHMIGAKDKYIIKQFMIYSVLQSIKGATAGILFFILFAWLFEQFAIGGKENAKANMIIGEYSAYGDNIMVFTIISVPLIMSIVAGITAVKVVKSNLEKMP